VISFGFSLAGLLVSLAILLPNLVLLVAPADGAPRPLPAPRPVIVWAERIGQAGCLVLPALTVGSAGMSPWAVLTALFIAAYWALWLRYLITGRRFAQLYSPLGPIPVPMAVFPVAAFFTASAWLLSWPLAVAAAVLAVGHIPTALTIARRTRASMGNQPR